jgi:BirA family biotin operon repressor/biotin-[acetyl-CoA-carboxylase] ligase
MTEGSDRRGLDSLGAAIEPTFIRKAEHFAELPSTNDRALTIVASLPAENVPFLILTDRQTAGRGRGRNQWFATDGVLTFSLVLEPCAWQLTPDRWPRLSVAVGGAVAEALRPWCRLDQPRLKWPNDVYIGGRKICGILVETSAEAPERLIVGIGLNVENSFEAAPPDVAARAISLRDIAGNRAPTRFDVLHAVLSQLDRDFAELSANPTTLLHRWRRDCELTGRIVAINDVGRTVTGTCLGIEDDASLLLRTESGPERCYAGTVTILD